MAVTGCKSLMNIHHLLDGEKLRSSGRSLIKC